MVRVPVEEEGFQSAPFWNINPAANPFGGEHSAGHSTNEEEEEEPARTAGAHGTGGQPTSRGFYAPRYPPVSAPAYLPGDSNSAPMGSAPVDRPMGTPHS
jgi:hypothetical protein